MQALSKEPWLTVRKNSLQAIRKGTWQEVRKDTWEAVRKKSPGHLVRMNTWQANKEEHMTGLSGRTLADLLVRAVRKDTWLAVRKNTRQAVLERHLARCEEGHLSNSPILDS